MMSTVDSEPRPATAFRIIDEEQEILDEFMAMVQKKMEIDERHLDELIKLRNSCNAKWRYSGLWNLISPMVTYFGDETNYLRTRNDEMIARFHAVPSHKDDPESTNTRINLRKMGENLKKAYSQCEECVRNINAPEAVEELAVAREKMRKWDLDGGENRFWYQPLPPVDRAYRRAVKKQHQYVREARKWYDQVASNFVELHQQRAEDIKAFVRSSLIITAKMITDMSGACSTGVNSINAFASTVFISPRHEELAEERLHPLLTRFDYHNFITGRVAEPIFGLGQTYTIQVVNTLLDNSPPPQIGEDRRESTNWAFRLEERALHNTDFKSIMTTPYQRNKHAYSLLLLKFALWNTDPLLPISPEHIARYNGAVPRRRLRPIVDLIKQEHRDGMARMIPRLIAIQNPLKVSITPVACLLCHNADAAHIVNSLWRKWEFKADCPLPEGEQRKGEVGL